MDSGATCADEESAAWALLRACAACDAQAGESVGLAIVAGRVERVAIDDSRAWLRRPPGGRWEPAAGLPSRVTDLLALYVPVCGPGPVTVAHLGQSLDGQVGTASGDSCFVNDPANIVHLHRMRALCDAVVVGGATVRDDDPRLTTRRVPGRNPLRVVIDPRRELDAGARVFRDGEASTLRVSTVPVPADDPGCVQVGTDAQGRPDLTELMALLGTRGCHRVFVEGGGVTVSRFLAAGLVDRLQVTVAPFIIGDGRPGLQLPGTGTLADCPRPPHRLFRLGSDLLFDLDLRGPPAFAPVNGSASPPVML